ncbi:MAG: S8 family serine peptidase [Holophagales bacterium]|nr:MAG: S8 family serine peptidase [Holophagales bacterium]
MSVARLLPGSALALLLFAALPASGAEPPGPPPAAAPRLWVDTEPHPRLAPALNQILAAGSAHEATNAEARQGLAALTAPDGTVEVVVETLGAAAPAIASRALELGGRITAVEGSLVFAALPAASLRALADAPGVLRVRRPNHREPDVVSEGVTPTGAATLHTAGYLGQGVKVGVLDCGGFSGYASLLGSELPAQVTLWNGGTSGDPVGSSLHGTACAEIVHDMAPQASLYLAHDGNEADFYSAVDWFTAQGVDVISYSCGSFGAYPYDGSGAPHNLTNAKVEAARQAGILWVNSAGNYADGETYEATYSAYPGTNWHSFDGGWSNRWGYLTTGHSYYLTLSWSDWPANPATQGASHDYNLELWRWDGTQWLSVAASSNSQNGTAGQLPFEEIDFTPSVSDWYYLAITRVSGPGTDYLNLRTVGANFEHFNAARSVSSPADSPQAFTVGALAWNGLALEVYSSRGPTLGPGGTAAGGYLKPDLVTPDGVSTATYGVSNGQPWPGGSGFFGTSASCPHVAGGAALLLDEYPNLTADALATLLRSEALDVGVAGADNDTGYGLLSLGFNVVWADGFDAGALWPVHRP